METRAIVGGVRRCDRAFWSDDEARAEVKTAEEMRIGAVHWDEVDERTWVGHSDVGYIAVVTSVRLPAAGAEAMERG